MQSGWWYGTFFIFIVGMMIQSDFHIFVEGVAQPPIRYTNFCICRTVACNFSKTFFQNVAEFHPFRAPFSAQLCSDLRSLSGIAMESLESEPERGPEGLKKLLQARRCHGSAMVHFRKIAGYSWSGIQ
jgi:hypothetical protein